MYKIIQVQRVMQVSLDGMKALKDELQISASISSPTSGHKRVSFDVYIGVDIGCVAPPNTHPSLPLLEDIYVGRTLK